MAKLFLICKQVEYKISIEVNTSLRNMLLSVVLKEDPADFLNIFNTVNGFLKNKNKTNPNQNKTKTAFIQSQKPMHILGICAKKYIF